VGRLDQQYDGEMKTERNVEVVAIARWGEEKTKVKKSIDYYLTVEWRQRLEAAFRPPN